MAAAEYYIGKKFGRLEAIRDLGKTGANRVFLFRCDCGAEKSIYLHKATSGHTRSCGCYRREATRDKWVKHGMKSHPLYNTWSHMRGRCLRKNNPAFMNYGGRGITICKEWDDFAAFVKWAEQSGYERNLEIDRINNDGPYSPENCRFVTKANNQKNKRTTVFVEIDGNLICLADAANKLGVNYYTLHARIRRGMTPQQAVSKHA